MESDKMGRLLPVIGVLAALCTLPTQSSAEARKLTSDFSSRQRCACSVPYRSVSVSRYHRYRVRSAYLIGYDPLPYRFGSTFVWERPVRYYR
jgi:hypothetical protein